LDGDNTGTIANYMKTSSNIVLGDVQKVYSGAEGRLWELLMGEQIHIGGFEASMDLAKRAEIRDGQRGIDLCCATGAGMRFLVRFCGVANMTGVDATPQMVELGRKRVEEEGLANQINFVEADVCATGLPAESADFVWGEDAWCYVEHKANLIREAARLIRPGGLIVFTDWVEGPGQLSAGEADRLLRFMKFPSIFTLNDYTHLLESSGCAVSVVMDTGRFAPQMPFTST
jgi:SAM-dependent methyltransferase